MSDEEKRRKLEQMSDNAKWRNDTRNKNVSKYKHDDKKEDEERDTKRDGPGEIFRRVSKFLISSSPMNSNELDFFIFKLN